MDYTTLIQAERLAEFSRTAPARLIIFDCRFNLADPGAGGRAYAAAHISGAHYLHLETELSGTKTGKNGRHPLPDRNRLAAAIAARGANEESQIVAYDAADSMFAARFWWLARWLGHQAVAVLDGGLAAWQGSGYGTEHAPAPAPTPGNFIARAPTVTTIDYAALRMAQQAQTHLILDARAPDRFAGENETLDPIGGHIPGARNRFFRDNLDSNNRFKTADQLRAAFETLLDGSPSASVVSECGSGVTACHNLLALEVAGLPGATLYPGSWSEWSAQPDAPRATGAE